jgi:hypothetical protein
MKTAVLVVGLAACSPSGPKDSPMSTPPPKSTTAQPGSNASPAVAPGTQLPIARSLDDLRKHEGAPVQVEGTFRFPTEKAFARNTLILDDGTTVVLPRPSTGVGTAELVEANSGARLAVRGLIYIGDIPAKYNIIGRTRDPYLVELTAVERVK